MEPIEFRIILTALLVGFMAHRGYYTRKVQHSAEEVQEQPTLGRASQTAGLFAIPAFLGTILYIIIPAWMSWAALPLPAWLRWLGVAIAVGGFVLLQWSQRSLGLNWSDAPKFFEGQEMVTSGPYRWIRHPIYAAFLLILGAPLLIAANWFVGAAWFGMTVLDVNARMDAEEAMMLSQFEDHYRAYMRRTGRVLPRLGNQRGKNA